PMLALPRQERDTGGAGVLWSRSRAAAMGLKGALASTWACRWPSGRRPEDGRELLRRGEALQGHGEAPLVVFALPGPQADVRRLERREAGPPPELLGIDAMAAFDLAVLIGPARLDVPVPNAARSREMDLLYLYVMLDVISRYVV